MPSISGATNFDDDMHSPNPGPVASWIREGREELGIELSDFTQNAIFLGLTRELLRGGKPEMFFAATLNVTKSRLEQKFAKAKEKWENAELNWFEFSYTVPGEAKIDTDVFWNEFRQLLTSYESFLSPPALTNLLLWAKYMLASVCEEKSRTF
jgi:hypothetical protein